MIYKDLGYEYIQQGLDENAMMAKITHSFYNVPMAYRYYRLIALQQ